MASTHAHPFDINIEGLLSINDVPRHIGGLGGRKPHISTVYRWALSGVGGQRLETVKLGGQLYTSKAALARFAAALSRLPDAVA